ncbi:hypothetical protein HDK77DRAFT_220327 [Phyllosticta capitalensis]|uniref:Large ribosomal subunit protein mL50 n=1 Tax=Phyllosticta capitalensis TaxID=121624 RepID=A0ABR1Z434_9PEZI
MRSLARLTRSIDRTLESSIRPQVFSHVCNTCRQSTAPFSTSSTRAAEEPKKPSQRLESLRRKLWGTDQPPGREDPYDPNSPMRQIDETETTPVRPGQPANAETAAEANDAANTKTVGPKRINRAQSKDGYQPARTWDGLEWVGSPDWVWKQKPIPNFIGLLTADSKHQAEDLEAALRKTLIEVIAHKAAFRDIVIAAKQEAKENWKDKVVLDVDNHEGLVLKAASPKRAVEEKRAWLRASIRDPRLKFTIAKRFMKDTGIRIYDITLQRCNDPAFLLACIGQQLKVTKKEKLAETLKKNDRFDGVSNVKIVDRRVTPIDKEKEVGRWKLIEDELLERGLPVTGRSVVQ